MPENDRWPPRADSDVEQANVPDEGRGSKTAGGLAIARGVRNALSTGWELIPERCAIRQLRSQGGGE
jgi:hypothetical protein